MSTYDTNPRSKDSQEIRDSRGNTPVQAGRLRRQIGIDVFESLAGANAPAKDSKTSRKG